MVWFGEVKGVKGVKERERCIGERKKIGKVLCIPWCRFVQIEWQTDFIGWLVWHKQKAKLEIQSLCIDQTTLCR